MPALLPLIAWPLTLGAALLVFGVSSQGTLGLISAHLQPGAAKAATPTVAQAIIRMPAPVVTTPQQAAARVAALGAGRSMTGGVTAVPRNNDSSVPTMQVNTPGLIVHSHPFKSSPQVGTLKQGEIVEVRNKQGGWMLINAPSGAVGWVFGKYLALKPSAVAG